GCPARRPTWRATRPAARTWQHVARERRAERRDPAGRGDLGEAHGGAQSLVPQVGERRCELDGDTGGRAAGHPLTVRPLGGRAGQARGGGRIVTCVAACSRARLGWLRVTARRAWAGPVPTAEGARTCQAQHRSASPGWR